jgi:hypothetical protein
VFSAGASLAGTFSGTPTFSGSPVTFTGQVDVTRTGTLFCETARTSGDANPRGAPGRTATSAGDGTAATDVNLFRGGTDLLQTNDSPTVDIDLTVGGNAAVTGNLTVSGIGKHMFARKTADESVTSSTTLQNDDHLSHPVVANAVYELDMRSTTTARRRAT